jgi:hypothetical protein
LGNYQTQEDRKKRLHTPRQSRRGELENQLHDSQPSIHEANTTTAEQHLTDTTAPAVHLSPPEPSREEDEDHGEADNAGPPPAVELPTKTTREKIFQAFNYLDTRWDPADWLGLGKILFRLTDGGQDGQELFEYWSFHYHPDFDDSKGVAALWEWFAEGGRCRASMRMIRCFLAAGFHLEQLVPESVYLNAGPATSESGSAHSA